MKCSTLLLYSIGSCYGQLHCFRSCRVDSDSNVGVLAVIPMLACWQCLQCWHVDSDSNVGMLAVFPMMPCWQVGVDYRQYRDKREYR